MRAFALFCSVLLWRTWLLSLGGMLFSEGMWMDLGRKGDEEKLGVVKGGKLWLGVIV